ncbi:OmpA/MotB domain protein (plasmid) [Thioalkalivibrio sp. K90mix]|uniref:OmpA family protein n=1 Tax=Thioalkalivibrio sp. (strain K90mix) TaxID=396595 RepID=UPI000195A8C5|nr:OmpA family protein [Thioalkalivibrio sp. K90mix]ADC73334.1 OmpA/MotB domain protein [Thioalkalivibrio sp. K90mix]
MRLRTTIATGVAFALLTGCAAMPEDRDRLPDTTEIQRDKQDSWAEDRPPVSRVSGRSGIEIGRQYPAPALLRDQEVDLDLPPQATMGDLVAILNAEGVPAMIRDESGRSDSEGSEGSSELSAQRLGLNRFEGSVGDLIEALEAVRDVAVEYRGGHLLLRSDSRYILSAPQNEELVERLVEQIEDLGGSAVRGELDAGVITYRAAPNAHEDIEQYVERAARNAAVVHLQLALLDVRLNREERKGFNWNELAVRMGSLVNTDVEQLGEMLTFTRQGVGAEVQRNDVSVTAVLNALSEYGDATTEQDITLTTVAGSEVDMRSGGEIPFVGDLDTTVSGESNIRSGASVDTQSVGIEVAITPRYDASTDLVTSSIDMDLTDVVQIREFDVGLEGGTLSHPELQDLSFTNISRLRPGEATLIGGIAYDQVDQDFTSLAGLEDAKAGSQRISTDRHAMFILLRPTVTVFTDEGDDLLPLPGTARACDTSVVSIGEDEELVETTAAYFRSGSDQLEGQSARHLEQIARSLQDFPEYRAVVVGYGDPGVDSAVAMELGAARGAAARDVVTDAGVSAQRVETESAAPPAQCRSGEVEGRDRRVDVWLIGPAAEGEKEEGE